MREAELRVLVLVLLGVMLAVVVAHVRLRLRIHEIRADAVRRSAAVVAGKVSEQLAPYMPGFPYDPKDARFLGTPIDLVVFDGMNEEEVREIVFLEIKTGGSHLSSRERLIRDAVLARRVSWRELRVS
jgi:predicted Holliday junction resolvase-like endonuclease